MEPVIVDECTGKRIRQYDITIPNQKFLVVVTNVNFATEDKINALKVMAKFGEKKAGRIVGTMSGNCILSAVAVEKSAKVADIVYVFLSPRMGMNSLGKTLRQIKSFWKVDIDQILIMKNYIFLDIEKKDMKVFSLTDIENMEANVDDIAFVGPQF